MFRVSRAGSRFSSKFRGCSAWERNFVQNFQGAPHGSTFFFFFFFFRMLRTGARFSSKFSACSARERDFRQNFPAASHGSAIFSQFSGRSAWERDFPKKKSGHSAWQHDLVQNFEDAPQESAGFVKIFWILRTAIFVRRRRA